MAYVSPTITGSGTTWAALRTRGLAGVVEALIAANGGLSARQKTLLRAAALGRADAVKALVTSIDNFLSGRPVSSANVAQQLLDIAVVLKSLTAAAEEIAVLADANPGSIAPAPNAAGELSPRRSWP